jgi:hypothetical protein
MDIWKIKVKERKKESLKNVWMFDLCGFLNKIKDPVPEV